MADLLDAAREIDTYCRRQDWRHCIIGGMALLRWGEQRMTKEGILIRQRVKLDWRYIYANLEPLAELKEAPGLVGHLRALETKSRDTAAEADEPA